MLILLSYKTENMCWERDDHLTLSNSETFRLVSNWKAGVINLRCARLEIPGVWGSHISISRLVKMLQHNMSESGHKYTHLSLSPSLLAAYITVYTFEHLQ